MSKIVQFTHQRRLPSGRAIAALTHVQKISAELILGIITQTAKRAEEAYYKFRLAESELLQSKASGIGRANANELDARFDSWLMGSETIALGHTRATRGLASPVKDDAELFLSVCYPRGASDITRGTYEEQAARMTELIKRYQRDDVKAAAARIGVAPYMDLIIAQLDDYKRAIMRDEKAITQRDVNELRILSHESLCLTIAAILSQAPAEHHAKLLKPIEEQTQIVRSQATSSRPATDINPNTQQEEPILS